MNALNQVGSVLLPGRSAASTRLRRDGEFPLRFVGTCLGRHSGLFAGAQLWHELALHAVRGGGYVVEIVALQSFDAAARPVRSYAIGFPTLDGAIACIEAHPASDDVIPGITTRELDFDDPTLATSALVLQASMLAKMRMDVGRRYRIAVGALLASLAWDFV